MTTTTNPVIAVLLLIVVIPSVVGRLDLRAFEDDDVPYVFGCRRGRCRGGSASTPRRWSAGVRRLDLSGAVDDRPLVVEASAKPLSGDDYDDDGGGRFPAFNDRRLMSFPYCSASSVDECRSLLRRLERLRLRRLQGRTGKRSMVVSRSGGTVVRLLGRRRRSPPKAAEADASDVKATPQRGVRSPSNHAAFDASSRLFDQYREWRRQNGYGQHFARWGRDSGRQNDAERRQHDDDDEQSNNSTAAIDHHTRARRSVVVEIEPEEEQVPNNERDMLDTYLAWRETHGYGTLAGRWG